MTARVFHAELWGDRADKYQWLFDHDVASHKWTQLNPNSPHYFFVPRDESRRAEYEQWPSITDVFPQSVTGIVTARDDFVIDFDAKPLLARINALRDQQRSDSDIRTEFFGKRTSEKYPPGDSRGWKLPEARKRVLKDPDWRKRVVQILYRPFDVRKIYYAPWIVDWLRLDMMHHMLAGENLGLVFTRPMSPTYEFGVTVANSIIDQCAVGNKSAGAGISYLAPLSVYPPKEDKLIEPSPWPAGKGGRRPNLSPEFIAECGEKLGLAFVPDGVGDLKKTFGPEDVFHYAYAVFHSPTYRSRYAEFLKIDFPRLPLTSDRKLFARLCALGAELVGLHLLERVPAPGATYPQPGGNTVEKPRYKPPTDEAPCIDTGN